MKKVKKVSVLPYCDGGDKNCWAVRLEFEDGTKKELTEDEFQNRTYIQREKERCGLLLKRLARK